MTVSSKPEERRQAPTPQDNAKDERQDKSNQTKTGEKARPENAEQELVERVRSLDR